jgi:hypothetical protein
MMLNISTEITQNGFENSVCAVFGGIFSAMWCNALFLDQKRERERDNTLTVQYMVLQLRAADDVRYRAGAGTAVGTRSVWWLGYKDGPPMN